MNHSLHIRLLIFYHRACPYAFAVSLKRNYSGQCNYKLQLMYYQEKSPNLLFFSITDLAASIPPEAADFMSRWIAIAFKSPDLLKGLEKVPALADQPNYLLWKLSRQTYTGSWCLLMHVLHMKLSGILQSDLHFSMVLTEEIRVSLFASLCKTSVDLRNFPLSNSLKVTWWSRGTFHPWHYWNFRSVTTSVSVKLK